MKTKIAVLDVEEVLLEKILEPPYFPDQNKPVYDGKGLLIHVAPPTHKRTVTYCILPGAREMLAWLHQEGYALHFYSTEEHAFSMLSIPCLLSTTFEPGQVYAIMRSAKILSKAGRVRGKGKYYKDLSSITPHWAHPRYHVIWIGNSVDSLMPDQEDHLLKVSPMSSSDYRESKEKADGLFVAMGIIAKAHKTTTPAQFRKSMTDCTSMPLYREAKDTYAQAGLTTLKALNPELALPHSKDPYPGSESFNQALQAKVKPYGMAQEIHEIDRILSDASLSIIDVLYQLRNRLAQPANVMNQEAFFKVSGVFFHDGQLIATKTHSADQYHAVMRWQIARAKLLYDMSVEIPANRRFTLSQQWHQVIFLLLKIYHALWTQCQSLAEGEDLAAPDKALLHALSPSWCGSVEDFTRIFSRAGITINMLVTQRKLPRYLKTFLNRDCKYATPAGVAYRELMLRPSLSVETHFKKHDTLATELACVLYAPRFTLHGYQNWCEEHWQLDTELTTKLTYYMFFYQPPPSLDRIYDIMRCALGPLSSVTPGTHTHLSLLADELEHFFIPVDSKIESTLCQQLTFVFDIKSLVMHCFPNDELDRRFASACEGKGLSWLEHRSDLLADTSGRYIPPGQLKTKCFLFDGTLELIRWVHSLGIEVHFIGGQAEKYLLEGLLTLAFGSKEKDTLPRIHITPKETLDQALSGKHVLTIGAKCRYFEDLNFGDLHLPFDLSDSDPYPAPPRLNKNNESAFFIAGLISFALRQSGDNPKNFLDCVHRLQGQGHCDPFEDSKIRAQYTKEGVPRLSAINYIFPNIPAKFYQIPGDAFYPPKEEYKDVKTEGCLAVTVIYKDTDSEDYAITSDKGTDSEDLAASADEDTDSEDLAASADEDTDSDTSECSKDSHDGKITREMVENALPQWEQTKPFYDARVKSHCDKNTRHSKCTRLPRRTYRKEAPPNNQRFNKDIQEAMECGPF